MQSVYVRDLRSRSLGHHELNRRRNDEVRVADDVPGRDRLPPFGGGSFLIETARVERTLRARIGAAKESLGGYTVLEIAGAQTESRRLDSYCARTPRTPVCTGEASPAIPDPKTKAHALARIDTDFRTALAAGMDSHRDPRVKAVVSIEPAEGPAIIPASLATIGIPIAFIAALGDRILPVSDNVIPDAVRLLNAQVTLFPKPAGHYTFLMNCAPRGRREYPLLCADTGPERARIRHDTIELAASFFARTIGVPR